MAEYERAGQILPENVINSKISKSLVFDLPCKSTELSFAIIDIEIDIEVKETINIDIEWSFKTIDSSIKSQ